MKQRKQDTVCGALLLAAKNISKLIFLNLLFLGYSLPLVTAGNSLGALVRCCMRLVNGEDLAPVGDFRAEFRKKDSLKACWLWILSLAIAGLAIWFCYRSTIRLLLLLALLALFGSGVLIYYLPMAVMIDIPPMVALQNSFALSLVLAKRTIPCLCCVVVWVAACAMLPPYTLVLALLAGASLPLFLCIAIGWPGVKELVVEDENAIPSSDRYYIEPKKAEPQNNDLFRG